MKKIDIFKEIRPKKRVIVELLLGSYILLAFFIFVVWKYILKSPNIVIEYLLLVFLLLIGANLLLNILSIIIRKNFTSLVMNNFLMKLLFPIAFLLGKIFSIKKENTESSYIELNNCLIKSKKIKVSADKILILLPRCMQNNECKNDVRLDIKNCKGCGKCDIVKINSVIKNTNVRTIVVTGGEQAREAIMKFKPRIAMAVACERELISGLMDISPFYMVGIINIRQHGPCFNTKVNVDGLKEILDKFLRGG
ncbi:MAG: DUF116 domain-containing protein [Candidatus Firestonebacteria bacterium]